MNKVPVSEGSLSAYSHTPICTIPGPNGHEYCLGLADIYDLPF